MNIIPNFLYRAFDTESYAVDFLHGIFQLGELKKYREIENAIRKDDTEGEANLKIEINNVAGIYYEESLNLAYIMSTAGPEVNPEHLKKFGKFIVKINKPLQLLADIQNVRPALIISYDLVPVLYTKGLKSNFKPHERTPGSLVSICQKYPRFSQDCEYRYILQQSPEFITGCRYQDNLTVDLNRELNYLEKYW